MKFPNLRAIMVQRHVRQYQLAAHLRMGLSAFNARLCGRLEFAPYERTRIAEYFALNPAWLFADLEVPATARAYTTAALTPAMETR